MPLVEMVFGEEMSRQENEASGWIVAYSRNKWRQDFTSGDSPRPNAGGGTWYPWAGGGSTALARGMGRPPVVRIQQGPTWADQVCQQRESRTIVQRHLPEQDSTRVQQLECENATVRSELQEIKALVEELRQREGMAEVAVNVQQADAQPRRR
ncbi:hypothetical protein MRX96_041609 [Rhipicephalus microplus]